MLFDAKHVLHGPSRLASGGGSGQPAGHRRLPIRVNRARRSPIMTAILSAIIVAGAMSTAAQAQVIPQTAKLLDRLCAQTLRINEEDRLFGMISIAVRSTIKYRGGQFLPDLIDDAVQDSLDTMISSCPEITATDEAKRLGMMIDIISDATTKLLEEEKSPQRSPYERRQMDKMTAADLSEELSSQEIDQWLNALPPRQRAMALFLYASDLTPRDIAAAVGEPAGSLTRQFAATKADLLKFFRDEYDALPGSANDGPSMQYREAGQPLAAVMQEGPQTPSPPATSASMSDGLGPVLRVTGISEDLYAGWSLLATVTHLPRGQRLDVAEPFLLEPDAPGIKRMLVIGLAEIGDPYAETRRFLLKAYAIDGEKDAAGLRDGFHIGAATIGNEEAKLTLANKELSSIEISRCLWHDYGTGDDPGLCR